VPSVEAVAAAHYRRQKDIARRAGTQVAKLWRTVERDRILLSWHQLLPDAFTVVATAQGIAAASSGVYVDAVLDAQGLMVDAAGRIDPAGFAGVASDGRNLASLLEQPALRALGAIKAGSTPSRAMTAGLLQLDTMVRTQIADAGRVADGVAITARPKVGGYVRMLSPPSCSRCIVLAGRHYRWNAGFQRHPRCDCRHIPAAEDFSGDVRTDPKSLFVGMDAAEQERVFGKAGAKALRDGADMARVVNARRGMYSAGGEQFTHEAAGWRPRLMPEGIYRESKGDRAEAIRLLKLHGFLI
jgi:hypothetical protein